MKNDGPSPHNFGIVTGSGASKERGVTGSMIKESETIDANKTTSLTIDLKPGEYKIICTIPGHVQLGMITGFTIT